MELMIHNDGKEKYQSFEAWNTSVDCERGYGSTKAEAIREYRQKLKEYSIQISNVLQKLELNSFECVEVDWKGEVLGGG